MKLLIDMNLSPEWVPLFESQGMEAVHWSKVGSATAADEEIIDWAIQNGSVIFTHDLDFGTFLARKSSPSPSVIQLRGQETGPAEVGAIVLAALRQLANELSQGALITIDAGRTRARILPLGRDK